jgi:hypothetical protein
MRFPRLPAEEIAVRERDNRIRELEAQAFDWIARGHEANIQLGRVFLQLKELKERGAWESYFIETFEPKGIPLRTGQHYMQLAKEADAVSAKIALFPDALDPEAQEMNQATRAAESAVKAAEEQEGSHDEGTPTTRVRIERRRRRSQAIRPYALVLPLSAELRDGLDQLRDSPEWDAVVREITAFLKSVLVDHDLITESGSDDEHSGESDDGSSSSE